MFWVVGTDNVIESILLLVKYCKQFLDDLLINQLRDQLINSSSITAHTSTVCVYCCHISHTLSAVVFCCML